MQTSNLFVALVMLAAVFDVMWRRIPNYLNFTLLILGTVASAYSTGIEGLFSSLLAVAVTLAVLLLPFSLNVYKGGDVKLCMGMSAWVGLEKGLWIVGLGIVSGGLLGLAMLITRFGSKKKKTNSTDGGVLCRGGVVD